MQFHLYFYLKYDKPTFKDHSPSLMDVYHGSKLLKQQEP
ncbi:hypothetical protein BN424_1286 [Carnobacterium maltaromaticum LMA28]|uniref:Uncharacterized protein n=1 Tax=Carnobacterium maltaromaticum LMA28 TaxID=1234679 RepID=K8EFW6_CARML|nr:hypothetical protein BN424_1286 [Carnobacterium maltaromaticum LMA28]